MSSTRNFFPRPFSVIRIVEKKKATTEYIHDLFCLRSFYYQRVDFIWVEIPDGLEELVPEYLDGVRIQLNRSLESLAAMDFESLRITGHNWKGVGAAYGFCFISEVGAEIENCAKRGEAVRIATLLEAAADYLGRVKYSLQDGSGI